MTEPSAPRSNPSDETPVESVVPVAPAETEAEERAHLAVVVELIQREIQAFGGRLDGRIAESHALAVAIQEQKRDMDHAEKANMRQAVNVLTGINEAGMSNYRRLLRLVESPYFGRIDVAPGPDEAAPAPAPTDHAPHPIYIGLHSFRDHETGRQLVHDWRAPISSMFYDFELGPAFFEAPAGRMEHEILRKRQYQIEARALRMMIDTSISIQDEILRDTLSRASDDRMRNIVATIQREQNAIIRDDRSHALVIQGAAGSGKTSIALHRIAHLLYRHREDISSSDVLVISPNRVFADYISQVLPELGEEMVRESTMEGLAGVLLGAGFRFQGFAEQVAILLEGRDAAYAERVQIKASLEFLEQLDAYMAHVRATNLTPAPVAITPCTFSADDIAARFARYASQPVRSQITRVLDDLVSHMDAHYQRRITGKDRTRVRKELTAMFRLTTLKPTYADFYEWLGRPELLRKARGGRYEHADVFPLVHLSRLVEPAAPLGRVRHVVIDEMQDYTPVQYRVIDQLFPCRKTILGDRNQAVSPLSASRAESIRDVIRDAECVFMHRSYRSTIQITALAQSIHRNEDIQPIDRHGARPALRTCDSPEEELHVIRQELSRFRESGARTLGIIARTAQQAADLHAALEAAGAETHLLDAESTSFSGGAMVTTAFLAKGLEFDEVIVPGVDAASYREAIDRHMLYIACTRAMHRLNLTVVGEPTSFLAAAREHGVLDVSPATGEGAFA